MTGELRRQRRMAMRGVPERLGLSFAGGQVEMRARPNGTAAGSSFEWNGYAAVYGVDFEMWDPWGEQYTESVAPGACKRSLANPALDVPFLVGHNDAGIPLARTKSGTMRLAEDSTGLHVHVPAMDGRREEVRALASAVDRGDMDEMSLAFVCNTPPDQQWDAAFERRTIGEMDIHRGDVCAVVHGANPATAGASMFPAEQLAYRRPAAIGGPVLLEARAQMSTADINDLPDSAFAHVEPGGHKDGEGKTVPRSLRHYPVHDEAHARSALGRAEAQLQGGDADGKRIAQAAMPAIRAAARKFGIDVADQRSAIRLLERWASAADDIELAVAPDYDPGAAAHAAGLTCPQCQAGNHGGAQFCAQCGHAFAAGTAGTPARIQVDDSTGIPGEETQLAEARKMEAMARELELEELAAAR